MRVKPAHPWNNYRNGSLYHCDQCGAAFFRMHRKVLGAREFCSAKCVALFYRSRKSTKMFKITPRMVSAAISTIAQFAEERKDAIERRKIGTAVEAVKMMDQLYQAKEELQKRAKSPIEALYDTVRFTAIPNLMEGEDLTNLGVEGIGRCHLQDDVTVKVEDKVLLHRWLTNNDLEDMITESVNAGTLAAFVRRRIVEAADKKEDVDLPDDSILTIKPIVRAVIVRGG